MDSFAGAASQSSFIRSFRYMLTQLSHISCKTGSMALVEVLSSTPRFPLEWDAALVGRIINPSRMERQLQQHFKSAALF
jgi:hypothetical protein